VYRDTDEIATLGSAMIDFKQEIDARRLGVGLLISPRL
jgi:hypothetical protein